MPKEEEKTQEEKAEDFNKAYIALCKKHGLQIIADPAFKLSQDNGTYSIVVNIGLMEYKDV